MMIPPAYASAPVFSFFDSCVTFLFRTRHPSGSRLSEFNYL